MVQKTAARGRPRSFDPDRVLADARDTFWKYGYAGTSMDQLAATTGLHKPSLYGAFGDKRSLYLKALNQYLAGVGAEFTAALERPRLVDSLEALIDGAIATFTTKGGYGCFMMSTAVPEAGEDREITALVRQAMLWFDRALERRFARAIEAGELDPGTDPGTLAMIVVANHYDMSARARAGFSTEELRALGARTVRLVAGLGGVDAAAAGPD